MSAAEKLDDRLDEILNMSWLSQRFKNAYLPDYRDHGLPSPVLGLQVLIEQASQVDGYADLSVIGETEPPEHVRREAARSAGEGGYVKNLAPLREAVAKQLAETRGFEVDPAREVFITPGGQFVVDQALRILVDEGDEVLVFEPDYPGFQPLVRLSGGKVVPVPLQEARGEWSFDLQALEERITPQTKVFLLSNSHNPTGILFSHEELSAIAELAQKHDFWLIVDEVWSELIYEGEHITLGALPAARERCVSVFSLSKLFAMSGYRIGWAVGPAPFIEAMSNATRLAIQAPPTASQYAAIAALEGPRDWLVARIDALRARRDRMVERLNKIPGIFCQSPASGCFVFPNVKALGLSSHAFAQQGLDAGFFVIPGYAFGTGADGHVRISFAVDDDVIEQGMDRLERLSAELAAKARS